MAVRNRVEHPIRLILAARRISYTNLAHLCGYSPAYIEAVCNGRTAVTDEFARRASQALDLPPDQLFGGIDAEIVPGHPEVPA